MTIEIGERQAASGEDPRPDPDEGPGEPEGSEPRVGEDGARAAEVWADVAPDPLDGMEGTVRAADGAILHTMRWPAAGEPWATLLLVHGLGEHVGRYAHVGRQLAEAGIETFGYDHRGFGGSAGERGHVDRWAQLHADLAERLVALRAARPELPIALYGHSMGGLVALGYVLRDPRPPLPELLVLSAPGVASTIPAWWFALARAIAPVLPRLRVRSGFGPELLSRDPEVGRQARFDPLNLDRTTVHFAVEARREQRRVGAILDRPGRLPVRTYVLHGTDDGIVPAASSELLAGRPNVTRRLYPGLRHEAHNEPEGATVVADMIAWLRIEADRLRASGGAPV